ncbi:chromosome transmission fidelity 4 isoform X2 [Brevipalpus obovatus]
MIKVINLENESLQTLSGHEAPILSVCIDPSKKYVASSSCDGSVRVWEIEILDCVKKWTGNHEKSNDLLNSPTLCGLCWNKRGNMLLVPNKTSVNVYSRDTWTLKSSLKQTGFEELMNCDISSDDKYIVAGNRKGMIVVWSYTEKNSTLLSTFISDSGSPLINIKFNPVDGSKLISTDEKGQYHALSIEQSAPQSNNDDNLDDILDDLDMPFDDDEEQDENQPPRNSPTYGAVSEGTPSNPPSVAPSDRNDEMNLDEDGGSVAEFDIGKIRAEYMPKILELEEGEQKSSGAAPQAYTAPSKDPIVAQAIKKINDLVEPLLQPSFQPGSSPIDFKERYMKWNSVGVITCIESDDKSDIYVNFNDITISQSRHYDNSLDNTSFIMADLSTEAVAFANGEENDSSLIYTTYFNAMSVKKDWEVELPSGEYAEALALGTGFLAVATSKRYIRIFSIGSLQLFVFSISGPVVCMAAQESSLMIIYHTGSGLPAEQSLSMMIVKIDPKKLLRKRQQFSHPLPVALSPRSSLHWAGFTDEGTPCTVDSAGIVRLFKDFVGDFWIPILDTTLNVNNKSDHYFIIGVSEFEQHVKCVFCKGSRYPVVALKPLPTTLKFELPICDRGSLKSELEEKYMLLTMRESLLKPLFARGCDVEFQIEDTEKQLCLTLLKLFSHFLANQHESLALDVAKIVNHPKALDSILSYAKQQRKMALSTIIEEIIREKEEDDEFDERNCRPSYFPSPRKDAALLEQYEQTGPVLKPLPLGGKQKGSRPIPSTSRDFASESTGEIVLDDENVNKGSSEANLEEAFENFYEKYSVLLKSRLEVDDEDRLRKLTRERFDALPHEQKVTYLNETSGKGKSLKRKKFSHKY